MGGKEWRLKKRIYDWADESNSCADIRSQEELDEVPEDYKGVIHIRFGIEEERAILDRELSAVIYVFCDSVIEICKPNNVHAWDSSVVYVWVRQKTMQRCMDSKVYNLDKGSEKFVDAETVSISVKEYMHLLKCKTCVKLIMNSMKEDQT